MDPCRPAVINRCSDAPPNRGVELWVKADVMATNANVR